MAVDCDDAHTEVAYYYCPTRPGVGARLTEPCQRILTRLVPEPISAKKPKTHFLYLDAETYYRECTRAGYDCLVASISITAVRHAIYETVFTLKTRAFVTRMAIKPRSRQTNSTELNWGPIYKISYAIYRKIILSLS